MADSPMDLAVAGADSVAGAALLEQLAARQFPVRRVYALGGADAVGDEVNFGQRLLEVGDLDRFDFTRVRLAFFCGEPAPALQHARRAADAGCVVIDATGAFAGVPEVPLVIPGLHDAALARSRPGAILSSPSDAAVALAAVLRPIADAAGIERLDIVSCEPVSGGGREGLEELGRQTADLLNFRPVEVQQFPQQIAFNLLPQVGALEADGHSQGERRLAGELQRLLADPSLPVNVTALRVPVFYGLAAVLHLQTTRALDPAALRSLLSATTGVAVLDQPGDGGYPTPVGQGSDESAEGERPVYVGRIRAAAQLDNGLNLWVVSDNMRAGSACNSVRIAEQLLQAGN